MDHATQALEEWGVPEKHKKQRIMESLRGPALEAMRNLKLSKDNCTAQDYLDVLQNVFGRTENTSELHYQLEHCFQKKGEKLSEFVGRLDKILHQILLKGIDPREVDKAQIQQVIRGAQPMDPIAFQLRTQQGSRVLKYPDLIRIIRQEEVLLDQKSRYL
ncbi:paraneoplastic antigen Ma1 homolog [Rana temporaria]|uniref:paraneoplastic antigen Ma1 homolog n=1 Tax=Rana temporaria TaxID=8407 RepID=UPI001AACBFA7|nr:paraneoplastic antigen Ma1 homolog [Rana temporaria]